MTSEAPRGARGVLSHFWTPMTAVGSHDASRPNAQICVSVFGASIVPDQPRLFVNLSKTNYTTELVEAAGTLSVTVLSSEQAGLLEPLGLRSGRDGQKLHDVACELDAHGDPWFPGGVGRVACEVIETYDLGDALTFLCAVREQVTLSAAEPLTWALARTVVGDEFLQRWAEKSEHEQAAARAAMHWRPA
ncbi:MAG: flavin reductase [Chloroflexi bacterium]|nr:MAG: flavin reductase [Chloroflexota bacterium]